MPQSMRRLLRRVAALCCALLSAAPAAAHNLPYSLATVSVAADGSYEVDLNCHTAALITGLPQTHLSPENRALFRTLGDAEVGRREAVMRDYLAQAIELYADGRRLPTPRARFPTVAQVREDAAQTPESQSPSTPIILKGSLPAGARDFAMDLPEVFGSVVLQFRGPDGKTTLQALTPGERTPPLALGPATARAGAIPAWLTTARQYVAMGAGHILTGVDHLVFVLGLLLLIPNRWTLVKTISAFTVAHSITLAAATLGGFSFSRPLLNFLIALSILALAPEIVRYRLGRTSPMIRHPWAVAFAFGLLHGFGFASGLAAAGLPPAEVPVALVLFNVGVEVGQLGFIAVVLGLARAFRLMEIDWPAPMRWAPTALVALLGALWSVQYGLQYFAG